MIAREGNQRTDPLSVSNWDRQSIAADIMMSRVVKKCSSGRVVLGQFIPVEGQNSLASPSNDRIDSGVLFLEIARLPRDRIRTNRTQQVRVLTPLRTQRNIRDMQHPNVDGDALRTCSRSASSWPKIVSVSRIAAESIVSCLASTLLMSMVERRPHRPQRACTSLWEG